MIDTEVAEATARLLKIRKLCDELDRVLKDSAKQRRLIVRMGSGADVAYRALKKKV
jgi:hypothetical protein